MSHAHAKNIKYQSKIILQVAHPVTHNLRKKYDP